MKDEKPGKSPETTSGEDQPIPTATPTTQARRRLLKRLATGSGVIAAGGMLPQKWTAPMVQSVLLPVHAQATDPETGGGTCTGQVTYLKLKNDTAGAKNNVRAVGKCPSGPDYSLGPWDVPAGGEIEIFGPGSCNQNKLGPNLTITVGGSCDAVFHTSCSQPIGEGSKCGGWLVLDGTASGSGALEPAPDEESACLPC